MDDVSPPTATSLWTRGPSFDYAHVELKDALNLAIRSVFDQHSAADVPVTVATQTLRSEQDCGCEEMDMDDDEYADAGGFESDKRATPTCGRYRESSSYCCSSGSESMSEDEPVVESDSDEARYEREFARWKPLRTGDRVGPRSGRGTSRRSREDARCLRCEAYDAHCKSAAEHYKRTLASYTKTVSQLMSGFKTVLQKYPELRADTSDERVYYMVRAATGQNALVREMVRLAAQDVKRGRDAGAADAAGAAEGYSVTSTCEALNTCYTDAESLRLTLEHYANLYVRYIEVWRGMCAKMTRDITALEFVERTQDRPGVTYGEPWSEARAYLARMISKAAALAPRSVGEACVCDLKRVNAFLVRIAPVAFERDKRRILALVEGVRVRLDEASSDLWSWDSHSTDAYLDLRSDLTLLESLIGIGEISVKSLLHDRSVLVSQLRKLTRNENTLELSLARARSRSRVDAVERDRNTNVGPRA